METLRNLIYNRSWFSDSWIIIYARLIQYYMLFNEIHNEEIERKLRDIVIMNNSIEEFDDFQSSNYLMEYTAFIELEKIIDCLEELIFKTSK